MYPDVFPALLPPAYMWSSISGSAGSNLSRGTKICGLLSPPNNRLRYFRKCPSLGKWGLPYRLTLALTVVLLWNWKNYNFAIKSFRLFKAAVKRQEAGRSEICSDFRWGKVSSWGGVLVQMLKMSTEDLAPCKDRNYYYTIVPLFQNWLTWPKEAGK